MPYCVTCSKSTLDSGYREHAVPKAKAGLRVVLPNMGLVWANTRQREGQHTMNGTCAMKPLHAALGHQPRAHGNDSAQGLCLLLAALRRRLPRMARPLADTPARRARRRARIFRRRAAPPTVS